jgi:hypothetical protein
MRKGFVLGSIALALGCGVAGAQTTYSPAAAAGPAAPVALLPSASAPVYTAPADHGPSWGLGHDVDGSSGGHLDAGFELLVIRPYFDSNQAATVSRSTSNPPTFTTTATTTEQLNFDYPYTANPRLWLGYVTDGGLGFRVSWWQFEQSSRTAALALSGGLPANTSVVVTSPLVLGNLSNTVFIPGTPAGAAAPVGVPAAEAITSSIRLQVWDFEATGSWHSGCFSAEGSAGVRYAHLSQNFASAATQANEAGIGSSETSLLASGHNFNGAGPTLAAELRQHLGDSGLGLYAIGRGAVLFGNKHATGILATETIPAVGAVTTFSNQFHNDELGTIGVGEAELGVEYSLRMGNAASLFVRAGIDGQLWIGAGNATSTTGNLGFFGYTFTVGVNY